MSTRACRRRRPPSYACAWMPNLQLPRSNFARGTSTEIETHAFHSPQFAQPRPRTRVDGRKAVSRNIIYRSRVHFALDNFDDVRPRSIRTSELPFLASLFHVRIYAGAAWRAKLMASGRSRFKSRQDDVGDGVRGIKCELLASPSTHYRDTDQPRRMSSSEAES